MDHVVTDRGSHLGLNIVSAYCACAKLFISRSVIGRQKPLDRDLVERDLSRIGSDVVGQSVENRKISKQSKSDKKR